MAASMTKLLSIRSALKIRIFNLLEINSLFGASLLQRAFCVNHVNCHAKDPGEIKEIQIIPTHGQLSKPLRPYGQPAPHTHPHLLHGMEVTPGISKLEYSQRRQRLIELVLEHTMTKQQDVNHHIILIPGATRSYMTNDIPYVFRQNTDFWYLSGFLEPGSVLLIEATRTKNISTLFVPPRNTSRELWDGPRAGVDGSLVLTGVDQALEFEELEKYLKAYLKRSQRKFAIWYDFITPTNMHLHNNVIRQFVNEEKHVFIESCKPLIQNLRLVKSLAEQELMRRACAISSEGFIEVMKSSFPQVDEHVLWARMEYECRVRGASYLAYPPVVAGGARANTIHYTHNNQLIQDGEVVLMDSGCEYFGYSSDVTRTWPVNARFSRVQRELYEAILDVQNMCIDMSRAGISLDFLYREMCLSIGEKLQHFSIIPNHYSGNELLKAMYPYCPHHVSHYLGMDIHDTADIPRSIPLQPGMVITIEPGIYINENDRNAPPEFRGMGIRIEDDVLISQTVPEVLSFKCPKHPDDIEKLVQKSRR